jgi:succinyl-CoA synthetase beta subunit
MKIHEYQAKAILKKYGVSVPRGSMAASQDEAEAVARELLNSGASGVVVKAQIHAGGRGKGGGVKIAKSVNEAGDLASKMLGMKLVTHQTGPEGRIVRRLLIEETLPIEKELYLGILVDRAEGKPVFMASAAGGMEIEQVAAENPDAILKQHIDPGMGLEAFQARKIAFKLGLKAQQINPAVQFLTSLYKAFLDTDASLILSSPPPTAACSRSMRRSTSTTTRCSVTPICASCATLPKKIRSKSRPRNTASITSSSMATWAAWSTAPDWPWRPWTSSSTPEACLRTSST